MSPTARTLGYLRRRKAMCAVVEKWNKHAPNKAGGHGIRQDLFGFVDILAVDDRPGTLAVQATSADHVAHRLDKFRSEARVRANIQRWLGAGNRLQIFGWAKPSESGRRKRWALRIVDVTAATETIVGSYAPPVQGQR